MEYVWVLGIVFGLVGLVLISLGVSYYQAKKAYYASLEQLKGDPDNPDLREQTLNLGRRFADAAMFLHSKGWPVILLDEAALANDISAACARAGTRVTVESDYRNQSIEERLIRLDDLRAKGFIREDEYETRRRQILSEA